VRLGLAETLEQAVPDVSAIQEKEFALSTLQATAQVFEGRHDLLGDGKPTGQRLELIETIVVRRE